MTSRHLKIGFLGGGQMAMALAEGFCRSGLVRSEQIIAYDPQPVATTRLAERIPGIRIADNNLSAIQGVDLAFLAVKPQQASVACSDVFGTLGEGCTLVSIVAGLSIASLEKLSGSPRVVRVMPNTHCLVGKGTTVVCRSNAVTNETLTTVNDLLRSVGTVHEAAESLLDAVTGLSGSGPGFLAIIVEALADGGVRAGLPRELAWSLAIETFEGTAAFLRITGEHPAQLKDRVASPGGTTITGLAVLEQAGVRGAIMDAVTSAARRSAELGQAATRS